MQHNKADSGGEESSFFCAKGSYANGTAAAGDVVAAAVGTEGTALRGAPTSSDFIMAASGEGSAATESSSVSLGAVGVTDNALASGIFALSSSLFNSGAASSEILPLCCRSWSCCSCCC